ncbi:hypothetical protein CR513_38460, partial [Mucuna pruriens]
MGIKLSYISKIDVHVGTVSIEFSDTLVQFNIFEAMKHPTEDYSLFGINLIDELVEECLQLDSSSEDIPDFAEDTDLICCLGSLTKEVDYDKVWEVHNLSDSEDDNIDLADLSKRVELIKLLDQVCKYENLECSIKAEVQVVETKKLFPAQVATMFIIQFYPGQKESATTAKGRDHVGTPSAESNSIRPARSESI